jgi:hypothetical protein
VLAVYEAITHAGSLVLCLSPSLRQSQELFRKGLDVYRTVESAVPPEAESALRIELMNGSRIISLPGTESTVRGYSAVRLLLVDEAARVADSLYHAVSPMLAVSGGRLLVLSTPFGKRGWWFEQWERGDSWQRVQVTASECPRIPAVFLEQERASLPAYVWAQEYECQFVQTDLAVFAYADIEAALVDGEPLWAT